MRKALIGAAKVSAALGALALVLAFLGLYLAPVVAAGAGNNGPYFTANATIISPQFQSGSSNYSFQINISNSTNGNYGNVTNVTFQLGRLSTGLYTNYTNSTSSPNGIVVKNDTAAGPAVWYINFTQEQIGGAGTYNYTWFANSSYVLTEGNNLNWTDTIPFTIAQNTTPINITLYLNNVTSNITYPRGVLPLNITAQTNITGTIINIYSNYTGALALLGGGSGTGTGVTRVENSTNLRSLSFAKYNITANLTAQNYSEIANASLLLTLNSSTINFILNLTYVNSSGYVSNLNSLAAFSPQFLAQEVFTAPETGCGHANMTVNFTQALGGVATIPVNNTCNYTVTVTMTDFINNTIQIFNSTFIINNLNATSGTGVPIYADIQLAPMGTYGKASPSLKSILGGFAFNTSNINATSSYQNASFALARRGYMPDGLYQCANWNQVTAVCSNWAAAATTPMTDFTNTTYLNKTITAGNFTFYGYSEPFYNLRPLVKAYGNASNITTINILNWGNQRTKYFSWVPMIKFNLTSKQAYLPSSDAYADAMYYNVPFFANPSAIEMLAYNYTVNMTFATQEYNQTFVVSITPRVIRSGQNLLSGVETPLMPAWSLQDTESFQGGNTTRTILRPTFNTLYYTYNGTTCGPYVNQSNIGPGSSARVNFYNVSMAFPCNQNLSYDYSTNEMNFTVSNENVTNPSLSVLFALGGRPTEGMYSPVYLVNQTFLGGFIPGPGQTPPSPGTAPSISFMVKVNNSLSNFTTAAGSDLMMHFLYPKNVTVWQNSSLSTINITANMGSGFQLWELNDTIRATPDSAVNATASGDVATATGNVWMMIANETHLWNATTLTYNTTIPVSSVSGMFVNRTFSCSNSTENFPGSPSNGKNITICFQEFDFNLTAINGWLPGDAKSNVTLNLTATLNVSILNEIKNALGTAGSTNQYNASISTASAGEIKLGETQMPGFNAANCGADFSNCSKTVIVDGSALNSSSYRTGSVILNLASGTHAVSVTYTVPAAAAATTTTTTSSGSTSTTVSDVATGKLTKTFTSIAPYNPRTITESELKDTNTGLTLIDISVKSVVTNVKIFVEKLARKPASITQDVVSANGMVYKFMNISKENLADSSIDKAKIKFKIEKSWLVANNFSALQIVMKRYTTQWDSLNTSMTSENESYAYYSADSPGFSVFAVAADKNVVTPVAPEQPVQPQQPSQETPQQQTAGTPLNMTIVYALAAIVAMLGGVLFMEMRKEKSDRKKSEK